MISLFSNITISPFFTAFGWVLLHSLWQGMIIFLIYKLIEPFFSKFKAEVIYSIQLLALLFIPFISVYTMLSYTELLVTNGNSTQVANNLLYYNLSLPINNDHQSSILEVANALIPWWVILWGIGFTFYLIRLSSGLYLVKMISATADSCVSESWQNALNNGKKILGLKNKIAIKRSNRITGPSVVGILRPIILIPASLMSGLSTWQVEAIVLHELAHIKRWDYLVNIFQNILEAIFFFNPFVWYLSKKIRLQRELCCDEMVIQNGYSRRDYVAILLSVEEVCNSSTVFQINFFGTQNKLKDRIFKIMGNSKNSHNNAPLLIILALSLSFVFISWKSDPGDIEINTDTENFQAKFSPVKEAQTLQIVQQKDKVSKRESKRVKKEKDKEKIKEINNDTNPKQKADNSLSTMEELLKTQENMLRIHEKELKAMEMIINEKMKDFPDVSEIISEELISKLELLEEEFNKEEIQKRVQEALNSQQSNFEKQQVALEISEEALRKVEERIQEIDFERLKEIEKEISKLELENMAEIAEKTEEIEKTAMEIEKRVKEFESKAVSELIKDGYLKKGEEIENLDIKNGEFNSVNGIKIKKEHQQKYNDLVKKYLGDSSIKWQ